MPEKNLDLQPAVIAEKTKEVTGYLYLLLPRKMILPIHVDMVKDAIKDASSKNLQLIIHSGGGDAYSAMKIIRILRSKFKTITGVLPSYAMSAATLILLGTNEIYMGEDSQLGPLDKPLEHSSDGSNISALDIVNTINQLGMLVVTIAEGMYVEMRDNLPTRERIGKIEAIKLAMSSATELVKPMTAKIDPYELHRAFRQLNIGQKYAIDLLYSGMFKGDIDTSVNVALKLVHQFPDHGYAIFRDEAQRLPLIVKDAKSYEHWDRVCSTMRSKMSTNETDIIDYIEE